MRKVKEVIFLEGTNIRKITGEVKNLNDRGFLILETLGKIFSINMRYIIKIEEHLPTKEEQRAIKAEIRCNDV